MFCGAIIDPALIANASELLGDGPTAKAKTQIPFVSVSHDDQAGANMESYALSLDSYSG